MTSIKNNIDLDPLQRSVIQEILDTKGRDLKIIDLRDLVSFTDYFMVVTGTSDRHVQAIADNVNLKLKREHKLLPNSYEGLDRGQRVLWDYGDFVLHVFQPEFREYYNLEEFWSDAPSANAEDLISTLGVATQNS